MRSRAYFIAFVLVAGSFALPHIAHASIPFFGPIIPNEINQCAAGWNAVMIVVNRAIELALTIAIVFIMPVMIAYAGFLYVVNPVDPSGISKAKKILINTIAGIVIALAGWMIVDAVMAAIYNPSAESGVTRLDVWSSLIRTDGTGLCLIQETSLQKLNQTNLQVTGLNASGNVAYVFGKTGAVCSDANPACSPSVLQAAGFTPAQANAMSCIAITENGGNATGCNGNACGTFQIMLTVNKLVGPSCGGTLDCPSLCKGNDGAAVATAACSPCVLAANNAACNAEAAHHLFSKSGYGPWTTSSDNTKSAGCVQQYGG